MIKECEARLQKLIDSIEDTRIKNVVERLTSCDGYRTKRASDTHHNYVGGLMQHALEVAENGVTLAAYFENQNGNKVKLSKDFIIFGGLLHDIGKTLMEDDELKLPRYYSHVAIGANMIYKELKKENFTRDEIDQLANIIMAHHSKITKEPNSVPYKSLEAYIIHTCDSASAVITTGIKAIESGAQVFTVYAQTELKPAFLGKNE